MSDQTKRYIAIGATILVLGLILAAAEQIRSERFSRAWTGIWEAQPEGTYPASEA